MKHRLAVLALALLAGCVQPGAPPEGRDATACGRVRFVANGEEVAWGPTFDRPTPELYHVEARRFINRIELAGGLFAEAIERDGTFCWRLAPGRYVITRVVPFQGSAPASADDRSAVVFPGVGFQVDAASQPAYLGTLRISASVRRDGMGNRWLAGKPSIEVLDEFERDRAFAKGGRSAEPDRRLMVRFPGLEDAAFHPGAPDLPALLRAVPWNLLMPRR